MAQVLPKSCMKRVAMEAGVGAYWYQYVGLDGKVRRRGSEHTRARTHTLSLSHTHTHRSCPWSASACQRPATLCSRSLA